MNDADDAWPRLKLVGWTPSETTQARPRMEATMKFSTVIGLSIIVLTLMYFCAPRDTEPAQPKPPPQQAPTLRGTTTDESLQAKRIEFIQMARREGYVTKLEMPSTLPHLWVTEKYLAISFDMKQTIASVALAYYHESNPNIKLLVIKDNRTGKRIGEFGIYGLKMY